VFLGGQKRPTWEHPWEYGLLGCPLPKPCLRSVVSTWRLNAQGVLQHTDDVRAVLVDPHAVVLSDHVRAGVAHLLPNAISFQVCFEKPISHDKFANVWLAALGVQKYGVQLVLADCLSV